MTASLMEWAMVHSIRDPHAPGGGWVVISRICDQLGIDTCDQKAKLEQAKWAVGWNLSMVSADGKVSEQYCLSVRDVPMWLANIEPSKCASEALEQFLAFATSSAALEQYQGCVRDVLWQTFGSAKKSTKSKRSK